MSGLKPKVTLRADSVVIGISVDRTHDPEIDGGLLPFLERQSFVRKVCVAGRSSASTLFSVHFRDPRSYTTSDDMVGEVARSLSVYFVSWGKEGIEVH